MVDWFAEADMIERRCHPTNRRALQLHLTSKSRKLIDQLQQKIDSLVDDMLAGLAPAERTAFARLLTAVGENLSDRRQTVSVPNG